MDWIAITAALIAMVAGLELLRRFLERSRYQPTTAAVTVSKVSTASSEPVETELFYSDIQVAYDAEGARYTSRGVAFTMSEERRVVEEVCRRYPPGSVHTGWYDPRNPAVLVFQREFEWLGLGLLLGGVTLFLVMVQKTALPPSTVGILLAVALFAFALASHLRKIAADLRVASQTRLDLQEVRLDQVRGVDFDYFKATEGELRELGFTSLVHLTSRVFERHGHTNISAFLLSGDRRTIASIGHMWYRRRLCGLIPLRFLQVKGVHFDSWLSDDSTLTTGCDPRNLADTFPQDMHRTAVAEGASLKEAYEEHLRALERLLTAKGIEPREIRNTQECIEYIELQIEKLNSQPLRCG